MRNSGRDLDNVSASIDDAESVLAAFPLRELVWRRIPGTGVGTNREGYSEDLVARAESAIRVIQKLDHSGSQAFHSLMDLLNGGLGGMDGLYHDDKNHQQGKVDLETLQLLYGVMLYAGEEPREAAKLTYIGYWHYCNEDDDDRNFVHYPEAYRLDRLKRAIDGFDWGGWYRWLRWDHEDGFDKLDEAEQRDHWTNDYGDPCYNIIAALVDIGCGQLPPEEAARHYQIDLPTDSEIITELWTGERYEESGTPPILGNDSTSNIESSLSSPKIGPGDNPPSYRESPDHRYVPMKWVKEIATEIDSRSSSSYEKVIRRLRQRGKLKLAEIKQGVDYRVYPPHLPDPPKANRIWFNGEEQEPGSESAMEGHEQEVMTDGGTPVSKTESHNKLQRIRKARDGSNSSTDGPEVYTCPIEGCSRTVVGESGHLINHVSQANDDTHQYRTLTEDLEVVVHWGEMDWGPGAPL